MSKGHNKVVVRADMDWSLDASKPSTTILNYADGSKKLINHAGIDWAKIKKGSTLKLVPMRTSIEVGDFKLVDSPFVQKENYFMIHKDGEGTEVSKAVVNEVLKKLFYEVL